MEKGVQHSSHGRFVYGNEVNIGTSGGRGSKGISKSGGQYGSDRA